MARSWPGLEEAIAEARAAGDHLLAVNKVYWAAESPDAAIFGEAVERSRVADARVREALARWEQSTRRGR